MSKEFIGSIVKMNPFRIDRAWTEMSSSPFQGESKVVKISDKGSLYVKDSNWWRRADLLIKGVDYNNE